MDGLKRLIFWMPWPPPWWIWFLALIVVAAAAGFVLFAGLNR